MSIMVWPIDFMRETAQTINTENESLLNEHMQRWQKTHEANATLPIGMQETFNTFYTTLETHLLGALTLHGHIGQTLAKSADLASITENSIAKTFNENE